MNIYNKLFILEYTRDPCICFHEYFACTSSKRWQLNLSKKKYYYYHRYFDLYTYVRDSSTVCKVWIQFHKNHRIIGPANISDNKSYYIRNRLISIHKYK